MGTQNSSESYVQNFVVTETGGETLNYTLVGIAGLRVKDPAFLVKGPFTPKNNVVNTSWEDNGFCSTVNNNNIHNFNYPSGKN